MYFSYPWAKYFYILVLLEILFLHITYKANLPYCHVFPYTVSDQIYICYAALEASQVLYYFKSYLIWKKEILGLLKYTSVKKDSSTNHMQS